MGRSGAGLAIVSVNSTITSMSITTVTASITVVKGPLACNSEMRAMADEGDRATERQPNRRAQPRRGALSMPFIKLMIGARA